MKRRAQDTAQDRGRERHVVVASVAVSALVARPAIVALGTALRLLGWICFAVTVCLPNR